MKVEERIVLHMEVLKKFYSIRRIVFLFILFLAIQVVRSAFLTYEKEPSSIDIYTGDAVEIEIKKYGRTFQCIIHNHSAEDIEFGDDMIVQVRRKGEWHTVTPKKQLGSALEVYCALANSSETQLCPLNYEYGILPIGKYRVVKRLVVEGRLEDVSGEFRVWF
jgi:hypothetical protein